MTVHATLEVDVSRIQPLVRNIVEGIKKLSRRKQRQFLCRFNALKSSTAIVVETGTPGIRARPGRPLLAFRRSVRRSVRRANRRSQ